MQLKSWLISSLLLLTATSLSADTVKEPEKKKEEQKPRIEPEKPTTPGITPAHSGITTPLPSEMYNVAARPVVLDGVDFFVLGEVLFMKPVQGGMEFAFRSDGGASGYIGFPSPPQTTTFPSFTSGVTRPLTGTVKSTEGKWDWGFRVGAGYNMVHDGWDITATWLRFHTHKGDTTLPNNGTLTAPLVVPPFSNQNGIPFGDMDSSLLLVNRVATRWKLNLDIFDLELGREFYVSQWMTLRPFFGPRAAFLPQHFKQTFHGGTFVANFVNARDPITNALLVESTSSMGVHLANKFWGVGPRAGLNTLWGMFPMFSLFGNADLSVLWGNFHVKSRFDVTPTSGVQTTITNIRNNHQTIRPVADVGAGIRFDYNYQDSFALGVVLGYEHMIFWGQNQFMKFDDAQTLTLNAENDDLAFAALYLGVVFDF